MLSDADLVFMKLNFVDKQSNEGATHWQECHLRHSACAIAKLIDTIQELRGAIVDNCSVTVKGEMMVQAWARDLLCPHD